MEKDQLLARLRQRGILRSGQSVRLTVVGVAPRFLQLPTCDVGWDLWDLFTTVTVNFKKPFAFGSCALARLESLGLPNDQSYSVVPGVELANAKGLLFRLPAVTRLGWCRAVSALNWSFDGLAHEPLQSTECRDLRRPAVGAGSSR
jgi:hypothetical protein